ncbi:MAG TPA: hypothetical protein VLE97_08690 [Gaiellaceae bacterium]|nr:hypothetical protein [Gaiellaceae bacterium]
MSSPASRKRQRHRRRADQKVWAAQAALLEREADLAAYERVVADMERSYSDTPFWSHALELVTVRRDGVRLDCTRLAAVVSDLEAARKALEPATSTTSDPGETISP